MNFTTKNGQQINLTISGDTSVVENEDGTISIYSAATDTTSTYDADGNVIEVLGNTLNGNTDTIIINTSGASITTGDGNDTIFNFSDNATISTSNGDDTVYLRGKIKV